MSMQCMCEYERKKKGKNYHLKPNEKRTRHIKNYKRTHELTEAVNRQTCRKAWKCHISSFNPEIKSQNKLPLTQWFLNSFRVNFFFVETFFLSISCHATQNISIGIISSSFTIRIRKRKKKLKTHSVEHLFHFLFSYWHWDCD